MSRILLKNATIVTGNASFRGHLGIDGERIARIWKDGKPFFPNSETKDLDGLVLMAGGIDAHVHFREPGLTWKADIASESRAALLGGITSFVEMPNTAPPTVSLTALEGKRKLAEKSSVANYGFHIGATNDNINQIRNYLDLGLGARFAGIKVFMGSSTGNMLVDSEDTLEKLFQVKGKTILVHSEDEGIIKANLKQAETIHGEDIPFFLHPLIRSREACVESTRKALALAVRHGTRLHILHVSTAEEVEMIREARRVNPCITAETSVNYLWFSDEDYQSMGGKLKCNPSVKTMADRMALLEALSDGTLDTIGSDHAPHLLEEKERPYLRCPSGLPTIQYSMPAAFTLAARHEIPFTRLASAFSENAARIFGIVDRGLIKEGFYADLVAIDPDKEFKVEGTASKCGWTPYEGCVMKGAVEMVWLNGSPVVSNGRMNTGTGRFRPLPLRFRSIG